MNILRHTLCIHVPYHSSSSDAVYRLYTSLFLTTMQSYETFDPCRLHIPYAREVSNTLHTYDSHMTVRFSITVVILSPEQPPCHSWISVGGLGPAAELSKTDFGRSCWAYSRGATLEENIEKWGIWRSTSHQINHAFI